MWVYIRMAQRYWKQANNSKFHFFISNCVESLNALTWCGMRILINAQISRCGNQLTPKDLTWRYQLTLYPTKLNTTEVYDLQSGLYRKNNSKTLLRFINVLLHTNWKGSLNSSNHSLCWIHLNIINYFSINIV